MENLRLDGRRTLGIQDLSWASRSYRVKVDRCNRKQRSARRLRPASGTVDSDRHGARSRWQGPRRRAARGGAILHPGRTRRRHYFRGRHQRRMGPHRQCASAGSLAHRRRRMPRAASPKDRRVEAWVGITAHTRAETLENLEYSLDPQCRRGRDFAALDHAMSRIRSSWSTREVGAIFERAGKCFRSSSTTMPISPRLESRSHLHTRDVKLMSQLPYVRGIKVTASKSELGNYTRAASHFKLAHEFVIYAGNAHLIFDLFAPPEGAGRDREALLESIPDAAMRFRTESSRAPPTRCRANGSARGNGAASRIPSRCIAMRRRSRNFATPVPSAIRRGLRSDDRMPEGRRSSSWASFRATRSPPALPRSSAEERREFASRFHELREKWARVLEPEWLSAYDAATRGRASANG